MAARLVPLILGSAPSIAVQRPVLLIGRHPESDVRIDLPQISRRHCCLAMANDRVVIRDLGSRNGLWVNGLRVDESLLRLGDELAIGPLLYRVEGEEARPSGRATDSSPPVGDSTPSAKAGKPPSLPFLPTEDEDDDDLIPLDL